MAPVTTRSQTNREMATVSRRENEERLYRRGGMVGVIIDEFRPCASILGTQLEQFRSQLREKVVNEIVLAESQGKSIADQDRLADHLVPERMRRIDQCRRSMLHNLEANDRYLAGDRSPGQTLDSLECARKLYRATSREIGEAAGRYDQEDQAYFAVGTLLMTLEAVVVAQSTDRSALYRLLIQSPPEEFQEFFVVEQIKEFTEDLLLRHIEQFSRIMGLFAQMPPNQLPRSSFLHMLRGQHGVLVNQQRRNEAEAEAAAAELEDDAMSESSS